MINFEFRSSLHVTEITIQPKEEMSYVRFVGSSHAPIEEIRLTDQEEDMFTKIEVDNNLNELTLVFVVRQGTRDKYKFVFYKLYPQKRKVSILQRKNIISYENADLWEVGIKIRREDGQPGATETWLAREHDDSGLKNQCYQARVWLTCAYLNDDIDFFQMQHIDQIIMYIDELRIMSPDYRRRVIAFKHIPEIIRNFQQLVSTMKD